MVMGIFNRFLKSRRQEIEAHATETMPDVSPPSQIKHLSDLYCWAKQDIHSVLKRDPAARSQLEVFLAYPGLHAVWMHRPAHLLWKKGLTILPRVMSVCNRFITGVDIHPGAVIGSGVFIDHAMGCVIGETAVVGDDCLIYQGSVLGGTSLERKIRHPRLGARVVVGANACVLGSISVGDNARIGSGSVVIHSVPSGATVVGVPGRIVSDSAVAKTKESQPQRLLDHANLPDPVAPILLQLQQEIKQLKSHVKQLMEERTKSKK